MCGIAGFLLTGGVPVPGAERVIARMTETQRHRGPDAGGTWLDPQRRLALGHRRLKVVDLSPAADQPMSSGSQRFTIVFNGEIYNHLEVRAQLDQQYPSLVWRGHSDTETLLAAIEHWGIRPAIERCIGMFAFAVWDRRERRLTLARDRMGEKPLYFGRSGAAFLFASEIKALSVFPGFDAAIDRDALSLFFWFNYIPAPYSIFKNIRKLRPGTLLTIDDAGNEFDERYWSLDTTLYGPRFSGSPQDAVELTESLLRDAVRRQSVADVPVGAFLSGGIDSSTIVALMRETSSRKVKTFSLGFEDAASNEAPYARAVAAHLETDHTELIVNAADARALIPRLPEIWDEPFGDSSQIPTALVSILARRQVTVGLTGDGGDELFCGYEAYRTAPRRENFPAKRLVAGILKSLPSSALDKIFGTASFASARRVTPHRLRKLAHFLALDGPLERHLASIGNWSGDAGLVSNSTATPLALANFAAPGRLDLSTYFSALDAQTYLVDDLLVKVDRAGMAASLETRMPMLDHRLVELAFRLPGSHKIRNGQTKWPLRRILDKHVPQSLIDRPKHGFSIPVATWLRGPLRAWAGDLLSPSALSQDGLLDAARIGRLWEDHSSGRHDHSARLWSVLMFQSWRAHYAR